MHDFIDEIDLYTKAACFIKFLRQWQSTQNSLFDRIIELTDAMVKHKFYLEEESLFVRAWLQYLKDIGCQKPTIIAQNME